MCAALVGTRPDMAHRDRVTVTALARAVFKPPFNASTVTMQLDSRTAAGAAELRLSFSVVSLAAGGVSRSDRELGVELDFVTTARAEGHLY